MKISSQKAKTIDQYLENHIQAEIGKWPIEISGEKQILPFYRFPIGFPLGSPGILYYNVSNGRLAMDVSKWEKENYRKIDTTVKEDAELIRQMLLQLDIAETKQLKNDIHKKKQMEPGVITHDGFVINGNRRMAVLEDLHIDEPTGKWLFLEAVRLPEDISEKDIWKIEAGLQLSKDKVAEYHPVNELLKIKQGIDAQLSIEEIAECMYGRTPAYITESISRLELIDSFLDFFNQPGNYDCIRKFGLHEYFIDIQNHVVGSFDKLGLRGRQRSEQLKYAFALIAAHIRTQTPGVKKRKHKGSITHWDIRKLGKVFSDLDAKEVYTQNLVKSKNPLALNPKMIIEDFRAAEEVLGLKEEHDQPLKLIGRAVKALQSIDRKTKHFKDIRVSEALQNLLDLAQEIKKEIDVEKEPH